MSTFIQMVDELKGVVNIFSSVASTTSYTVRMDFTLFPFDIFLLYVLRNNRISHYLFQSLQLTAAQMKHQDIFVTTDEPTDYSRTRYHRNVLPQHSRVRVMKSLNEGSAFPAALLLMGRQRLGMECHQSYKNLADEWVIIQISQLEEGDSIYLREMASHFVV